MSMQISTFQTLPGGEGAKIIIKCFGKTSFNQYAMAIFLQSKITETFSNGF